MELVVIEILGCLDRTLTVVQTSVLKFVHA